MPGSFAEMIPELFSGVMAAVAIAATYLLCVRPVLNARRRGDRTDRGASPTTAGNTDLGHPGKWRGRRHEVPADAEWRP